MSQKKTQNSNGNQLPWMVLVILFAGLGAIACDNDPKPGKGPGSYTPSAHLGQGETCPNSTQCTFKDYRTNATTFPQAINRVGKLDNYGNDEQAIKNAAKAMEQAYTAIKGDSEAKARFDNLLATAAQITSTGNHNLASGLLKISTVDGNDIVIFLKKPAHGAASWNTEHLGIGESCLGASCSLQDYRTTSQKSSFPKAINRYGKESNYTAKELRDTADNIIKGFGDFKIAFGDSLYNVAMGRIEHLCVALAKDNSGCTWDGKVFGADSNGYIFDLVDGRMEEMVGILQMLATKELDAHIPDLGYASNIVVQLQPTNAVRVAPYYARKACFLNQLARRGAQRSQQDEYSVRALARTVRPEDETRTEQPVGEVRVANETRTEQPVVAEGGDKEPKLNTVAQRFERMNRSAIARNNRNMV